MASTATHLNDYAVAKRLSQVHRYLDLTGKNILDIGCGNGIYTIAIGKYARHTIGIDISDNAIKGSKINASKYISSNVDFLLMSAEAVGLQNNSFDVIISIENLEHINNEKRAIQNVEQLLKPNGQLVIYVPNKFYPFETHGLKIGGFMLDNIMIPLFSFAPKFIRRRFERARIYTAKDMHHLLVNAGFTINVVTYMFPPLDKLKNTALRNTFLRIFSLLERNRFNMLGLSILIIATKYRRKNF